MAENPHYKELLQLLNEFQVEYLIVGGFAVSYGSARIFTDKPRDFSLIHPCESVKSVACF